MLLHEEGLYIFSQPPILCRNSIINSSCGEEPLNDLEMAASSSRLQCRGVVSASSSSIDVSSCREEPLNDLEMAASSSRLECRLAVIDSCSSIDVSSGGEESLNDL